jgi:hypothetical protein
LTQTFEQNGLVEPVDGHIPLNDITTTENESDLNDDNSDEQIPEPEEEFKQDKPEEGKL